MDAKLLKDLRELSDALPGAEPDLIENILIVHRIHFGELLGYIFATYADHNNRQLWKDFLARIATKKLITLDQGVELSLTYEDAAANWGMDENLCKYLVIPQFKTLCVDDQMLFIEQFIKHFDEVSSNYGDLASIYWRLLSELKTENHPHIARQIKMFEFFYHEEALDIMASNEWPAYIQTTTIALRHLLHAVDT